jgi:hypothetical protein
MWRVTHIWSRDLSPEQTFETTNLKERRKVPYLGGGGLGLYGNTLAKQELV